MGSSTVEGAAVAKSRRNVSRSDPGGARHERAERGVAAGVHHTERDAVDKFVVEWWLPPADETLAQPRGGQGS